MIWFVIRPVKNYKFLLLITLIIANIGYINFVKQLNLASNYKLYTNIKFLNLYNESICVAELFSYIFNLFNYCNTSQRINTLI